MKEQSNIDYKRIASAIDYINQNFKQQPSIDQIASAVNLSPSHFKRLFIKWAGTTPKRFLQFISIGYAKSLLQQKQLTLFDTAIQTGLSSTSRLHDLFIKIEGMSPLEYKQGGKNLIIKYGLFSTLFGEVIIGSTQKGICYMAFYENKDVAFSDLKSRFPNAIFIDEVDEIQKSALSVFSENWKGLPQIKLHLKATDFQLKVWESLLRIPLGDLTTYGAIADTIGNAKASRAVGTAIGNNPVAFLIPCHRVIQSSGMLGGYMWGTTRKIAIIGWEGAKIDSQEQNLEQ